jgi:competence protein ComEC
MPKGQVFFGRLVNATFSRRPAVATSISLVIGLCLAKLLPIAPTFLLIASGCFLAVSFFVLRRPVVSSVSLLVTITALGTTLGQWHSYRFSPQHIAAFTTEEPRLAEMELAITSPPRTCTADQHGRPLPPKQSAQAAVLRLRTREGWQNVTGDISLTLDQPYTSLQVGHRIGVIGLLQRPQPAMNPGQFDLARYDRLHRILAAVTVPHINGVRVINEPSWAPLESFRAKVRHLLSLGFTQNHSLDHAVLLGLTLGERDVEMRRVQDDFSNSGTAHLLAVSGLHVLLIAALAMWAGRVIHLHPRWQTCAMMLAVTLYTLAAVPAAPVLRATVLCLAFGISQLLRRSRDGIQTLALCALILLILRPEEISSAGFQLSFITVLAMLLCATRFTAWCNSIYDSEDTRVARSFRPPGFWTSVALHCRQKLTDAVAIGCIAWLASMPLVMYHFDQLNPLAVLNGLLLLPVVALGLLGGVFKIILTFILPTAATLWASLATVPMQWMRAEVNWLAHLPGVNIPMAVPPIWQIVVFYLALSLPLFPWSLPSFKRWIRCTPAAAAMLAMLPLLIGAAPTAENGETRITLLAVGAGQIGIIELSDGRTLLIDDGSNSLSDPLRQCLAPYLRGRGCRTIETIYLSHPDFDHISAAAETADAYHPRAVRVSPVFRDQSHGNIPAESMLHHFDTLHTPLETLSRGSTIPLGDETQLDALWPPDGRAFTSTNNAGLVLRLAAHGRTILFPADIQTATERELMTHPDELRADILVAPHHGSAETTTPAFIAAVRPRIVLCSNDRRLSKKQREFDRLCRDYPLYRTSIYGAITVHITRKGELSVETFIKR